jgi:hypothetical protein
MLILPSIQCNFTVRQLNGELEFLLQKVNVKKISRYFYLPYRVKFYLPKKGEGEALPACCLLAPHVISQNRIVPYFLRLKCILFKNTRHKQFICCSLRENFSIAIFLKAKM